MMRIECLKNGFKKIIIIHFLGQKWHFLGLGNRPKTTVQIEVKTNLKKEKLLLGCFQSTLYQFFFHLKHKKSYDFLFLIFLGVFLTNTFFWARWKMVLYGMFSQPYILRPCHSQYPVRAWAYVRSRVSLALGTFTYI